MKRILALCLCLVLMLLISCKKKGDGRIKGDGYTIEETLDSLPLVTVSDKEVVVVDLKSYDPLSSYPLKSTNVLETFLFKKSLFVVSKDAVYHINIEDEKIKKTTFSFEAKGACGLQHKVVIWGEGAIYEFNKNEKVEKIAEFDGQPVDVQPFPGYASIVAVLEKEGTFEMAKISLLSKELERKERLEDFVKMRISPFGKRIYILTKEKLVFLDAKNLRFISEIPFEGEGVDFIVTASENKVFVFTRNPAKIISIKRTILKVESETSISFPPSLETITDDGGTVFFLAADSLFRFDTGSNAIVKTAAKKANQVDMLLTTPKGLRVVIGKKGEKVVELLNGNTLLLEKEVSIEGDLLHVICGSEPFRQKEELSPDTLVSDSTSIEPLPHPQKGSYFTLQVSSSSILEGAQKLMKEIKGKSLPAFIDSSETKDGATVYRVKIGAFELRKDAEKFSKGLKSTYGIDSWISKQELTPFYLSEAGIDINGDKSGELLLYEKDRLYLFTNQGGVQKSVFTKQVEGVSLSGTPVEVHDDNVVLLAVSFKPDSLLAIRWFDNKYEVVKRKAPPQ